MDETAANIIDRETALADFDHARDDFMDAIGEAPDEALDYVPEGEEYSIGFLVPHVAGTISRYLAVLDMIEEAQFEEVRMAAEPEGPAQIIARHQSRLTMPLRAEARMRDLEELEELHDRMASRLREMVSEEYARPAPVYYPGYTEAYPTRASDILQWITDHYREHVVQIEGMLTSWKQSRTG